MSLTKQLTVLLSPFIKKLSPLLRKCFKGPLLVSLPITSIQLKSQLNGCYKTNEIVFFADYSSSHDNYLVDADGNRFLDLFQQYSSLALGYNHPAFASIYKKRSNLSFLNNRPAMAFYPPQELYTKIEDSLMSIAPKGLNHLQLMMCGSCANENALKLAINYHQRNIIRKNDSDPPDDLLSHYYNSTLINGLPGIPKNLCVLKFDHSFHGLTLGTLTVSSAALAKVDFPMLNDFAVNVPFPSNIEEEDKCIAELKNIIHYTRNKLNKSIVALIMEPIQAEGGDRKASETFYQNIRQVLLDENILLILDEIQTGGGATGKWWNHSYWNLQDGNEPDIVTFSKKMCVSGLYYKEYLKPSQPYRMINTWCGDPIRLLQCEAVIHTVKKCNLLDNVIDTGHYLKQKLIDIENEFKSFKDDNVYNCILNVRGIGFFVAFDCVSQEKRNAMLVALLMKGINCGFCATHSIRLRPALIFGKKEADIFSKALRDVIIENHPEPDALPQFLEVIKKME